jgi:hypothetical protein
MKIRAWSSLALASTMMLVGLAACSSGSGGAGGGTTTGTGTGTTTTTHLTTGTGTGTGGGGPACGLTWTGDGGTEADPAACETCMEGSCCTELDTCGDPTGDCYALLTCLQPCGATDAACQTACLNSHQTGYTDYQAIQTCFYKNCQTDRGCEYNVSCGGKKTANVLIPDDKCATCLATNCCTEYTTCDADATCGQCGPYVPADQNPAQCAANTAFTTAESCTTTKCAAECNFMGICDSQRTLHDNACDYALGQHCCAEFKTCVNDNACISCIQAGGTGCAAAAQTEYNALKTCWNTNASTECGTF